MAGSILHWLKKTANKPETVGLPDPASCSTIEEVQSTQAANDAVDKLNTLTNRKRKRGEYGLYDAEQRANFAKLAIDIGRTIRVSVIFAVKLKTRKSRKLHLRE